MAITAAKTARVNRKVQILIADDHAGIRKMVRSTLDQYPLFEVLSEAMNGAEAVSEAKRLKPDVVVLNISMPVMNGFEAAREIRASLPEVAIVILSSNADCHFIEEAKRVGARAYVRKTQVGDGLIRAINEALEGDDFVVME